MSQISCAFIHPLTNAQGVYGASVRQPSTSHEAAAISWLGRAPNISLQGHARDEKVTDPVAVEGDSADVITREEERAARAGSSPVVMNSPGTSPGTLIGHGALQPRAHNLIKELTNSKYGSLMKLDIDGGGIGTGVNKEGATGSLPPVVLRVESKEGKVGVNLPPLRGY